MKTYLVSFTTTIEDIGFDDLELRQIRLNQSARKFGIKNIISWNRQKLIKTDFYKEHKNILDQKKGAGYWLWKPYIILDTLNKVNEGDFVIYSDSSMCFILSPKPLLEICERNDGFYLIDMGFKGRIKYFTQKSCFILMNANEDYFYDFSGSVAGFQIYRKSEKTIRFVKEWLRYCTNPNVLIDDNLPLEQQLEGFTKHQHDQSILSILRAKYKIEGFRAPYQYGNYHKLPQFRKIGEFLMTGYYDEDSVFHNSPYDTILDYKGDVSKRPLKHYFMPKKILGFLKRKLNKK